MDRKEETKSYFQNIFQELKVEDWIGFKVMFHISLTDYEFLLSKTSDLISRNEKISGNRSILANERLALTLRYLAAGKSFQSLSYQFGISLVAVSYIVKGCCSAINDGLQNMFIELPNSGEKWLVISRKFEQPNNGGLHFHNYKHTHSIILLAIAGPEYECLYTDVGSTSRVNGMLNKCSLLQAIDDRSVKLPEDDYLTNDCKLPYVFLGDDAFALKEFMKKPYPQQNLTADKRIYNYRHSRARRILENLLGILTNRWRIYFTIINLEPKIVKDTVLTTLILHNMLFRSPDLLNSYRPAPLWIML